MEDREVTSVPLQCRVWMARRARWTYERIQQEFQLNARDISRCLKRTALGQPWDRGMTGGCDPYLCQEDENELVCLLLAQRDNNDCFRTFEVLDLAHALKVQRHFRAVQLLLQLGSCELARKIKTEPPPPSRPWLNDFVKRHGLAVRSSVELDRDRHSAGFADDIASFYRRHAPRISEADPRLVFNADETMLSAKRVYKAVTDQADLHGLSASLPPYQHMSALVTVSCSGAVVPPFIILSSLQNVPSDLEDLVPLAWWGSSANGWVTKRLFTCWAINFAHWLTAYRERIDVGQNVRALLFLDGHSSRINFAALEYLARANCDVIILPAHTSHITQAFDVALASPLKAAYKQLLLKFTRTSREEGQSLNTSSVRRIAVASFLDAHREVLTITRQRTAFKAVGLVPFDPMVALRSPYIRPGKALTAPERFTINGFQVTDPASLAVIRNYQTSRPGAPWQLHPINAEEFYRDSRNAAQTEGRLLNRFESLMVVDPNGWIRVQRFA